MEALVEMDYMVSLSLSFIGSDDVRKVGIWGMAGIGKTIIAEAVQKIRTLFEDCCFLSENDPAPIQMELLSQRFRDGVESLRLLDCLYCALPADGLRLSPLTGLKFLKKLNLSDCNLLEGALPSDLSSLSWLECLDLSRNNFITVPSLSRLPHLRRLIVDDCKNLLSLPELPSSVRELSVMDCTYLGTFSYPSSAYALRKFGDFNFEFSNCFRLMENEQSDTVEAILQVSILPGYVIICFVCTLLILKTLFNMVLNN